MRLLDIFDSLDCVAILAREEKVQAMQVLVDRLVASGKLDAAHREDALRALLKREAVGSTGIGRGAAIPHARVDYVTQPVGAIGISAGIDFGAVDHTQVRVLFLLLSPVGSDREHLEALGLVGQLLQNAALVEALGSARSGAEVLRLIRRHEP
ncbi:MAG: PTS sugar transporter subunit IIA [Planctomycetota bacterium]